MASKGSLPGVEMKKLEHFLGPYPSTTPVLQTYVAFEAPLYTSFDDNVDFPVSLPH